MPICQNLTPFVVDEFAGHDHKGREFYTVILKATFHWSDYGDVMPASEQQPILPIEVPRRMGVRVDQARQHRAVAQVHEARTGWYRPAGPNADDAASRDENIHVVLHSAAPVENGGGTKKRRVLARKR